MVALVSTKTPEEQRRVPTLQRRNALARDARASQYAFPRGSMGTKVRRGKVALRRVEMCLLVTSGHNVGNNARFHTGQGYRNQSGFSLLEILVAFVIMGILVGSLMQVFSGSMRGTILADEYSYATQVGESALARLGVEIPIESNTTSGQDSDPNYQWSIHIEPYEFKLEEEVPELSIYPYRIEVDVHWQSGDADRHLILTSLRFGKAP